MQEWQPGSEVVLTGLQGMPELNGERGVVQPTSAWPADHSRIAVMLKCGPKDGKRCIAVRPANLKASSTACVICLEEREGEDGSALLATGCACRGSSGWMHERCAIQAAAARQGRAGWAAEGGYPWRQCHTCKLPYTGAMFLALAREWCRRTAHLEVTERERFAARTTLGNALSAAGNLSEAEKVVRSNLETMIALNGPEHPHALGMTMNLGLLLSSQGKVDAAAALYKQLAGVQERVLGPEHRDTLSTRMLSAGASLAQGKNTEAEEQCRRLRETQLRVLGADDPSTLTCAMNLGSSLLSQGRLDEAEAVYRENLAIKTRKLGEGHPDALMVAMNLASVLKERGRMPQAAAAFRANMVAKRRLLGEAHNDTCLAALNLVGAIAEDPTAGREAHVDAEALAASTHASLARQLSTKHPTVLSASVARAVALAALGECSRAEEILADVLPEQRVAHGVDHPDVLETAWRLGALRAQRSSRSASATDGAELATAELSLRDTAARQAEVLGAKHPRTQRTMVSLAETLTSLGRLEEARGLLAGCVESLRAVVDAMHPDLLRAEGLLDAASCAGAEPPSRGGAAEAETGVSGDETGAADGPAPSQTEE
jgi:tetratricopeptide (TPR) repeat protein